MGTQLLRDAGILSDHVTQRKSRVYCELTSRGAEKRKSGATVLSEAAQGSSAGQRLNVGRDWILLLGAGRLGNLAQPSWCDLPGLANENEGRDH